MKGCQKKQKPLYLVCQDLSAQISSQVRLVKDTDKLEDIEVTMRTLLKQLKEATETEDDIDIIPFYDNSKNLAHLTQYHTASQYRSIGGKNQRDQLARASTTRLPLQR